MRSVPTFCRICESQCGLIARVEGQQVVGLDPDTEHPVSRGYACRKGTHFHEIHGHADRLLRPFLRGSGAVPWEEALAELGGRLRRIRRVHGPGSVGLYLGNASSSSFGALMGAQVLQRALGTDKSYSSLTLDNSPMFVVTEACLGNPMTTFVADYANADLVVLIGTDPLSSQPSQAQSNPGGNAELRAVARRGQLIVVDPRASTTAKLGLHLRPRPGTDVALLAFLVREVCRLRGGEPALAEAVAPFDAERVQATIGFDPRPLAERMCVASRPLVWSGLGVLLGPDGTVGYWLTLALQHLLGGLDRPGGWVQPGGAIDVPWLARKIGLRGSDPRVRSRVGGYPAVLGSLAAATMADDILTEGEGRLRALVVVAGNPAVALPDTTKALRALGALELLICVDLFENETGRLAHGLLPAADWLERDEVELHYASLRRVPHLQIGRAVVAPRGDARTDHAILCGLARATGAWWAGWPSPMLAAKMAISAFAPFSWRALEKADRGIVAAERPVRRTVTLAIPAFLEALGEVARRADRPGFRLVTSVRPIGQMNTWIGEGARVAGVNPLDHARLGSPARVRLEGPGGQLVIGVSPDAGVVEGCVVVPWADGRTNPNHLVGSSRLERFTGQPCSNGEDVVLTAMDENDEIDAGPSPGVAP